MILKGVRFKPRKVRITKARRVGKRMIFGKKMRIGCYGLIIGTLLLGIYRFLSSSFFSPIAVNVSIHQCGEYACLVEGDVQAQVEELFGGKNLIFTDFQGLANQLKNQNLVVAKVNVHRSFLSRRLEVEVVGRKALAVVRQVPDGAWVRSPIPPTSEVGSANTSEVFPRIAQENEQATPSASKGIVDSGTLYFVDEERVVFAEAKDTFGLPIIPLSEGRKVELGEKIEGNYINTYLEILRVLDKNKINAQNIEVEPDGRVFIYVSQGPEVIVLSQKNIEEQIGLLAVILQRYRVEGKRLKKVDLRFEKPVVGY